MQKSIELTDSIDGIIDPMSEDQFTKLFKYVELRFNKIDIKLDEASNDRTDIRGAIGELSAQV